MELNDNLKQTLQAYNQPDYQLTAGRAQPLDRSDFGDMGLRWDIASQMGQQGIAGDNDFYDVFNWPKDPDVEAYYGLYLRGGYPKAVVDIPVNATWRDPPEVTDDEETDDTEFEEAVSDLNESQRIWNYCKRADQLAGIGEYGVLVLEFDDISDPGDFNTEVTPGENLELAGLRPFSQESVEDIKLGGPASGRWGEPIRYKLDLSDEDDTELETEGPEEIWVHHSRIIHVPSDELLDDEIRGTPRMEPILNNLIDIIKSRGSAAEVAYRASAWGLNVNIDKDYQLNDDGERMREHLQRWNYGLEPILRTQGANVQSLGGEDIDPSPVIDVNIEEICAEKGFPQSVLKGNETGERATTQDLKEWYGKVMERREQFVAPMIVRELINRLREYGVLPEPKEGTFDVEWQPLDEPSEKEISETRNNWADTAQKLSTVIPEYSGEDWKQVVEDGEFPEVPDVSDAEPMDEERLPSGAPNPQDAQQFQQPAVADGGEDEDE